MRHIGRDLGFGLRLLRKSPGFTSMGVLALALGIGATTAMFSVVYATLLAPLPYPEPDELVVVWSRVGGERSAVSAPDYLDWSRESTSFEGLGATAGTVFNLSSGVQPVQVAAVRLTTGFMEMFGETAFRGRYFRPDESTPGRDRVVIITHRLWKEQFGGDPDVVGKQIRMDGEPYTVVGVRPPGQPDRLPHQIVVPLSLTSARLNREERGLIVIGRLKSGVSRAQAQAEMDAVATRIAAAFPSTSANVAVSVEPLKNNFLPSDTRTHLWLLLGAVGFVMLIACANVANLLLARGTVRQREIAVRMSLGATRREILGQFLVESLSLALVGGVVGVALGFGLLRVIVAIMPPFTLPSEANVALNLPVLFFTLVVTMLSGILFGCAPAFQAAGLSLSDTLKDGGRTGNDSGRHGVRRGLVVAEFAFAVVLLAGAGLALHSFWNLTRIDLGIRPAGVLTFSLPVPADRLAGAAEINTFYRRLLEEIRAIPGVQQAAVSTGMPLRAAAGGVQFSVAGRPMADGQALPAAAFMTVTPGYLDTFGAQVARGRGFTEADVEGGQHVALVNESFAARHLAGLDPLQESLMIPAFVPGATAPGPPVEWRIVGVFRDIRSGGLSGEQNPEVYVPFWQALWPQTTRVAVRTSGSPQGLAKRLAGAIKAVDPELPMVDVLTMQQVVDQLMASDRFNAVLYSMFAGVALVLAMVGISGVMAFTVAQRTHEIGLRTALGARRRHVLALVLKEGLGLALVGLGLGLVGASLLGRVMQGMLYGIEATDPVAFGSVSLLLLAAALVGCLLPAYRAARVDPLVALRQG